MKFSHLICFCLCMIVNCHASVDSAASENKKLIEVNSTEKRFKFFYALSPELRQHVANFVGFNTPNKYGWLPLQIATANGLFRKTEFLLDHGANANLINELHPISPLSQTLHIYDFSDSKKNKYAKITRLLLDHKANPYLFNEQGQTAIHETVLTGNIKALQNFIQTNVNLQIHNQQGQTPLELAQTLAARSCMNFKDKQTMVKICRILYAAQIQDDNHMKI